MAVISSSLHFQFSNHKNPNFKSSPNQTKKAKSIVSSSLKKQTPFDIVTKLKNDSNEKISDDEEVRDVGVKVALSMLKFYKREISPLMPNSCRYVPTCSEYSMIAYKRYGVLKGTILTTWRLCRCNPLGGSGFDPPRWFDEGSPPEQ
ncbi:hypothetical protein GIB67_034032 [Kingdonia uniflora]|uniref:Uncharacterized protein n=1 Tax=Kingdonia uniflora TaxID=39325 RepID=A0A7J7M644_9MAGN|nr:hypothetical protein GIB67_034032 [Kingdonia uniflora]